MASIEQIMNSFINNISEKYDIDKKDLESLIPMVYEKRRKRLFHVIIISNV